METLMTGTSSRTVTALDVGVTPGVRPGSYVTVRHRGREGAWGRSCRQSPDLRYTKCIEATVGGRDRSIGLSPMSSGPMGVVATGRWGEGHASYPRRSVRPPMRRSAKTTGGRSVHIVQAGGGRTLLYPERTSVQRTLEHGLGKLKNQRRTDRSQQRPQ